MSATDLDVKQIAHLARLQISEEETGRFQEQLSGILDYVRQLQAVDVEGIEPTAHTTPVFNVFRIDEAGPSFPPEVALSNAPRQANQLFVVAKVIE